MKQSMWRIRGLRQRGAMLFGVALVAVVASSPASGATLNRQAPFERTEVSKTAISDSLGGGSADGQATSERSGSMVVTTTATQSAPVGAIVENPFGQGVSVGASKASASAMIIETITNPSIGAHTVSASFTSVSRDVDWSPRCGYGVSIGYLGNCPVVSVGGATASAALYVTILFYPCQVVGGCQPTVAETIYVNLLPFAGSTLTLQSGTFDIRTSGILYLQSTVTASAEAKAMEYARARASAVLTSLSIS